MTDKQRLLAWLGWDIDGEFCRGGEKVGWWPISSISFDLNFLFKYAVPKLHRLDIIELYPSHSSIKQWDCLLIMDTSTVHSSGGDPAQALKKSIMKVIDNER